MDDFVLVLQIIGLILLGILAFALVIALVVGPYVLVWAVLPVSMVWKCILTVVLLCVSGGGITIGISNV